MKILGIETSCDETAAAVVEIDDNLGCTLLSNVVASSMDLHVQYGGVVPEIAARSHIEAILPVIDEALTEAVSQIPSTKHQIPNKYQAPNSNDQMPQHAGSNTIPDPWDQIDAIAVTYGAGLGGSLLIGVMTARTLAIAKNKPLYGVNHVEGHLYANFITKVARHEALGTRHGQANKKLLASYSMPSIAPLFPMLGLIVSGNHSQLVFFRGHFDYILLGQTNDDAIGEAFDKVAKILGLPYPGGPSVEKKARAGDPYAYTFPKAKLPGKYDFSYSGPKTAVLRAAQHACGKDFTFPSWKLPQALSEAQKADIAASFQRIAIETVVDKTVMAFEEFKPASFIIGGGVAASPELRRQLTERLPLEIQYPDPKLCTDNGAMIATLGAFKASLGQPQADPYTLSIEPNLSM